jgi:hypothetical protein
VQNNARLFDADCGVGTNVTCGCPLYIHDNRILVDVDPAKAGVLYRDGGPSGAFTKTHSVVISYLKNIDIHPAQHRFWNNEFVVKSMGTSRGYFMDLQGFGNAQGHNNGSLWLYGNLFRYDPAATQKMSRFWLTFCDIQTGGYAYYLFNNTFDMDSPMDRICDTSGDLVVERNNAFLRVTTLLRIDGDGDAACQQRREHRSRRTAAYGSNTGAFACRLARRPRAVSPTTSLALPDRWTGTGSCDPDGDGVRGTDWNGDGTQETQWVDLAGNAVNCSSGYGDARRRGDPTRLRGRCLRKRQSGNRRDLRRNGSRRLELCFLGFIAGRSAALRAALGTRASCVQNAPPSTSTA